MGFPMTRLALALAVILALFQIGDALTTAFALQSIPGAYEQNALAGAVMAYLGVWGASILIKIPIIAGGFYFARRGAYGLAAILGGLIPSVAIVAHNLVVIGL